MSLKRYLIVVVIVLVGGCGDHPANDSPAEFPEATLPGVYTGVFPCEGCPGIASTLWVRADGRYFFRQRYPSDDAHEATDAYSLGRWNSIAEDHAIELRGVGPGRTFVRLDRDTLRMETDSDLEYRLTRDPAIGHFSATIRMMGTMQILGDSVLFTECLTGFVAPVSKGGDFARFRHQYRSAGGRSKAVYVELEGRFSWSDDGALKSLTIERFVTIKADGAC